MTKGMGDPLGRMPVLRRRMVLAGIAGLGAFGRSAWRAEAAQMRTGWEAWARDFLMPDGRVVDPEQGGISHSEGQAYGLLLAQSFGDAEAFARIEGWTRAHLAIREDSLMAWKWQPDRQAAEATDWRNATDGDLLRAWALLRASRDSGWRGYEESLRSIARDLVALCLAPDPRAPSEHLLLP
ncbi:glycosyl hydrolase family 8 [Paracoccus cavernae]|uniref:cellulase n=1 Tax=Paracoccus cavernae TaxID=1571207 RepID=A0ABT8D3V3_9RHOB|nr:glycosyl hydrolase family 8 [Paracoccus cavernae]